MEPQERIVSKAHELFMRYGIRSVSMDEVANQLGISKKTIYQFYTDKDALVDDVIDIELADSEKMCKQHKHKSENAVHEIFMAMDMVLDIFSRMNPSLIFDMEKYHPRAFKKYNDYKDKFLYTMVKENLESGISDGLYREDIQVDILSRFRLASIFLVFNPELFQAGRHNLGVVIKEITDNFLCGLATAKGQKLIQKYKHQRQKPHTL
ncbi:TetR/AcrR family transcriptional regulator [Sediminibacterium soli]|uniref:TetR/AcrR family transcriptional regulator n=1 Tax=Sediminibacterium soli TaxID=2698829 RepID=UPI00137946FC|nr:TetR/AcrR family transcriptional regulator [Sediminibacterium soli]NCI45163.1 TetR/AcrR family transcriptional regulator [Sediminibacterium soli]